jgi:hypothetical protein
MLQEAMKICECNAFFYTKHEEKYIRSSLFVYLLNHIWQTRHLTSESHFLIFWKMVKHCQTTRSQHPNLAILSEYPNDWLSFVSLLDGLRVYSLRSIIRVNIV